jgi:hypothetical protein
MANAAIVPAGASGALSIFVSNAADVILDIKLILDSEANRCADLGLRVRAPDSRKTAPARPALRIEAGRAIEDRGASASGLAHNSVTAGTSAHRRPSTV